MDHFHICPVSSFYEKLLLPVSYSLLLLLGLSLNGALLWCVCRRTQRWSSTVIYMTNLAVTDLLYVLTLPPLIISDAMGSLWPFGDLVCKSVRFSFLIGLHCSMMFLTGISVHRFVGVCFPIAAVRIRTRRVALFVSASIWIVATAEIAPTLFFAHSGVINNMTVCYEMTDPAQFKVYFPYGLSLILMGFLIPFVIIISCYLCMVKVLYCRAADSISTATTARMRQKSLCTLLAVFTMFVVCFVPYHLARTVYLIVRVYMPEDCELLNVAMICFKVWKPVVGFNSCANPLLYFLGSGSHRQRVRAWLWRRRKRVQPGVCVLGGGEVPGGEGGEGVLQRDSNNMNTGPFQKKGCVS